MARRIEKKRKRTYQVSIILGIITTNNMTKGRRKICARCVWDFHQFQAQFFKNFFGISLKKKYVHFTIKMLSPLSVIICSAIRIDNVSSVFLNFLKALYVCSSLFRYTQTCLIIYVCMFILTKNLVTSCRVRTVNRFICWNIDKIKSNYLQCYQFKIWLQNFISCTT